MPTKSEQHKDLRRYLDKLAEITAAWQIDHNETLFSQEARKRQAKKDYRFFVDTYFPHYATEPCADFHLEAARLLLKDPNLFMCLAWFRGAAKSTHMNVFVPAWLHLFHGQIKNMILVGSTERAARLLLQDVQAEFEANPQLTKDFGNLVGTGNWAEGNFFTATGAKFNALGKGQSPRGARKGPHRPDYIVCDDLDEDEEVRNPTQVDKRIKWIKEALIPSMGTSGRFVNVNNIIGPRTIQTELMKSPGFRNFRVNAILPNGQPAWPQRYSLEFYERKRRQMGTVSFDQEYNNTQLAKPI